MTDANKRSTDNVIMQMAGDVGYIKGKVETLVTVSIDHEARLTNVEGMRKTARGFLIGATVLAGTAGSAVHTFISKALEHFSP